MVADRYDINARSAKESEEPEKMKMLQALLVERFQLKFHKESRILPGYALVLAKGGLKVAASTDNADGSTSHGGRGKLEVKGFSMAQLADRLSRTLSIPVANETGVAGGFDYTLEWSPEEQRTPQPGDSPSGAPLGPTLFTALQEKLGVKLESRKIPMEVYVIDSAEKPGAN
jgi:uncharacterized protein (TIGR03435 family)